MPNRPLRTTDEHDAGTGSAAGSRLRLLTQAARGINAELPLDELLRTVSETARTLIGAHQAVISLTTDDHGSREISALSLSDKYARWRDFAERPDGGGIYVLVVEQKRPLRLTQAELEAHPAFRGFGAAADRHPPLRGWLAAPLLGRDGECVGLLQLSDKYEGDFTTEDEQLLEHLAQLALLAVEGARAREEALMSRVLIDALQSASPVGFVVMDEELRFVRINACLAEANGVPAEQHVGRRLADVVPELAEQLEPDLRRVLEQGTPSAPKRISGATGGAPGEPRHWLVSHYPVNGPDLHGVGSVVIEVTDAHLAAERVRRSEERYRKLLETTQDLVWAVDADGRFQFISGAVERFYGYRAEEMMGRSFADFMAPGDAQAGAEFFRRAVRGESVAGETRLLRKDGSLRTIEFRGVPLLDESGEVIGVTGASTDVTERRRSEEALRGSEERLRHLFEDAAIGMAVIDESGRFVQANPAFCRLLGRRGAELAELRWEDVLDPDDRAIAARRLESGSPLTDNDAVELRHLNQDGRPVWTRVMTAPMRGGEDSGERFTLVQAIDLTERRRLEETTSRLYGLSRDLFCTVGFDGLFKSLNPGWERALGYTHGELMGTPFMDLVHEEDRNLTRREFERLKVTGELTLNFENRYRHKDGTYRWLLWSAHVSESEELIYGVAKDVNDRKRSEERLRESERKYRDLVETSSDLIWSVDTAARFTFVNRAARRIYGYEPEEMLGRAIADFEPEEQRLKDQDAFQRLLAGTPLFNYETRHVRKDGRRVDLSVNAIVLHDDQGAVLGATGTATDVTDRRRFEARQAAVAELGRRALEEVSLEDITAAAVELASDALGLEYAAVVELSPDGAQLSAHASVGWPPHGPRAIPADGRSSHAGHTIATGRPVVVRDFMDEERFPRSSALAALGARSGVCAVIEGESGPFGVLCVHSTRRRSYSSDEVNFLQAVANVLATAIGRKRNEQRIVQLAAARGRLVAQTLAAEDRARRSISEVLHDHALQDLLASRQDLVEVSDDPEGDPERVVRAREGIERAVQLLRDAVFNLHPVVLEHAGLASAIRAVADHQGRRGGFESTIDVEDEAAGVHDELVLSLARELLTNVAKHAGATSVRVQVGRDNGSLVLLVEDDGRGIAPGRREQALHEGHVGLASSAERVEALAGTFSVETRPGGGTRARAELPARREAPDRADAPRRVSRTRR